MVVLIFFILVIRICFGFRDSNFEFDFAQSETKVISITKIFNG